MSQFTDDERELFTEDQLAYLQESERRSRRRQSRRATAGFLILLVGLVIGFASDQEQRRDRSHDRGQQQHALVLSSRAVAVEGCNRDYVDRERVRSLLQRLREASDESYAAGRSTSDSHKMATLFYNDQLRRFSAIDCRTEMSLLTDNPDKTTVVPRPFYPGGPDNPRGLG